MYLVITLRKEVEDEQKAQQLFEVVKQFLIDKPEITVTGSVSSQLHDLE